MNGIFQLKELLLGEFNTEILHVCKYRIRVCSKSTINPNTSNDRMALLSLRSMNEYFKSVILQATGASAISKKTMIQELWSGYGALMRVELEGANVGSVVAKYIQLSVKSVHPRGWNTDLSHQRKLKSYQVEKAWYEKYSKKSIACLPKCLATEIYDDEMLIALLY